MEAIEIKTAFRLAMAFFADGDLAGGLRVLHELCGDLSPASASDIADLDHRTLALLATESHPDNRIGKLVDAALAARGLTRDMV
jgi:hypothetical protein